MNAIDEGLGDDAADAGEADDVVALRGDPSGLSGAPTLAAGLAQTSDITSLDGVGGGSRASPQYSESPSPRRGSQTSQQDSFREGNKLPDFADSDFYVNPDSVTLGPSIGEGAFSTVYAGRYFGDTVAVKKQTRKGKDLEKYLLRELQVLKFIRHPNMLEYIGAYNVIAKSRGQLHAVYIITEYAAGGDLLKLLLRKDQELGWKFRIRVAKEGLEALEYLHSQELIHRDIKSSNFLLDADWRCKLSDFGMAREVAKDGKMTICGTDEYMAPEMLFDEDFSHPADMYSFGMVLLELITRRKIGEGRKVDREGAELEPGFAQRHPKNLFTLEEADVRAAIPADAPPSLVTLTLQCLEYEANLRPTAEDARAWLEDLLAEIPDDTAPLPSLPVVEGMLEADQEEETLEQALAQETLEQALAQASLSGRAPRPPERPAATPTDASDYPSEMPPLPPQSNRGAQGLSPILGHDSQHNSQAFIPSKMGYLHVKNQGLGFRNWKKRWFVLKGGELIAYKDGGHIENVDLRGCTLVRGKTNRFQVVKLGEEDSTHNLVGLEEMELAATNASSLEAWLSAIQSGIDYANGQGAEGTDPAVMSPPPANDQGVSMQEWLRCLKMEDLWPMFQAKGLVDMARISARGLRPDDMDKIGLKNPLRRRYLESLGRSPFKEFLQVSVVGHRSFGDVVVFKVVTEWRAWYSKTEKLYTDFNKLHNRLRRTLKDADSPLLNSLPELPGKGKVVQNQKDPAFILMRKRLLQGYMQELTQLFGLQEPYFTIMCDALDLLPSTPEPAGIA